MERELAMAMAAAAASSECSSGCQSGWTTYLDDRSSSSYSRSCGAARVHGKQQPYCCGDYSAEEDDLSMISDASSGPRQHSSGAGGNVVEGGAERQGRREEAAAARRQSKRAAAAASLLEDTASSPAFFAYSKEMDCGEVNGYGHADAQMMEIGNATDFSYAFSTTTGFKMQPPLNGTPLGGFMQMQYSPAAAVKPTPARQTFRDAAEKKRW